MAEFIENDELTGDSFSNLETESTPEVKPEVIVPEVPEKYRGKSLDDIIKMHSEAEKLIGKQAQEVGEVRKLADELLRQQLSPPTKQAVKEEEEEVDFFVDPQKAVNKAVENHPTVKRAEEAAAKLAAQEARQTLLEKHSDMSEIVQSPEFVEWVKKSKVRVGLYMAADQNLDMDAADELLSTYKELKALKPIVATNAPTKTDADVMRQDSLRAASVDASGTGEAPKKIYRRTDLIRLRMEDPDRYNAMSEEIMRAYAEKRVK